MAVRETVVDAIGNTPLIRLRQASELTGCTILGKAEFMNPGQSVKDRTGKWMILGALERGEIERAGLVVESTGGNTGIGLTVVAKALGLRTTIVIPNTQSSEKKDLLRLYGADLIEVPALPFSDPGNYQHVGRRLAERLRKTEPHGVLYPTNGIIPTMLRPISSPQAPRFGSRPMAWWTASFAQSGPVAPLTGVSRYLKERNKQTFVACADPRGAAMFELFRNGIAKASDGSSITEGIGLGRATPLVETAKVDDAYVIPDDEALALIYDLMQHEGLCVGGSTGINVAGAIRLAKQLGPGKTIVTLLCDGGDRYQSKLFNPEFLLSKNLPSPPWLQNGHGTAAVLR